MTKQTVLLAFDNDTAKGVIKRHLENLIEQFDFTETSNIADALELLKYNRFDCALIGAIPESDLESIKVIADETPVIAILSAPDKDFEQSILSAGSVACWQKEDVSTPMLSCCLSLFIERNALQKELHRVMQSFERRDLDREISSLLSWYYRTTVTAETFGLEGIKQTSPEQFNVLVETFCGLIDKNLDERTFKVAPKSSLILHDVSQQLGLLNAGPRDVIELYATSLRAKIAGANQLKIRAYSEVARTLVLELMGYMVSHYRNLSKLALRRISGAPEQREGEA